MRSLAIGLLALLQTASLEAATGSAETGNVTVDIARGSAETGNLTVDTTRIFAETGSVTVDTLPTVAPFFIEQPQSSLVALGSAAVFEVAVGGDGPTALQWRKGTSTLPLATSSTLTLVSAKTTDAAAYSVVASNGVGTPPSSDTAYLGVVTPLQGTRVIKAGGSLSLSCTAVAPKLPGVLLSYAWRRGDVLLSNGIQPSGAVVAGVDQSVLVISRATPAESGIYTCLVTLITPGNDPTLASGEVSVQVVDAVPVVDAIPLPDRLVVNQPVDVFITASNSPTGFSASGLPAGMKFDAKTGRLTGSPNAPSKKNAQGLYLPIKLSFKATNPFGTSAAKNWDLIVEGYVGNFEALLRDPDTDRPLGLLKLTVPTTSRSATASLALADQAKPLALAGPLSLDSETRVASARLSRVVNKVDTYRLDLTLSLFGELAVEVRKNNVLVARAEDGARLRDAVKGETVPQAGAYTVVLEPSADAAAPSAPGWATARVDAAGQLAMAGRLSDGTAFTASLPVDVSDDYRLFVQPYKRSGAYVGGTWGLTEHPGVAGAWQVRDAELTWEKSAGGKDPGYRGGFGPLAVTLEMDAWQPASKTSFLAQLLGAQRLEFAVETTSSPSETQLPTRMAVEANGVLRVLAPTNARKWAAKVNPATGAFSGSFELVDGALKRKVSFGGVLRQSVDVGNDGLQGRGQYLLPPLRGAPSTQTTTGWVEFRREE